MLAYRLLAEDTVEERDAQLKAMKRELFDSLLVETASLRDFDLYDLRSLLAGCGDLAASGADSKAR